LGRLSLGAFGPTTGQTDERKQDESTASEVNQPIGEPERDTRATRGVLAVESGLTGELPADRSQELFSEGLHDRPRPITNVQWEATNLAHRPLYFEDEAVERNGQYRPFIQPAVSAAHFFGRVPALPYMMANQWPHSCVYSLGSIRPGSCVEPYRRQWPLSANGALTETGVVTGLFFLIP